MQPLASRGILDDAVGSVGEAADEAAYECGVFVGEDPEELAVARTAGLSTAADPALVRAAIEGHPSSGRESVCPTAVVRPSSTRS